MVVPIRLNRESFSVPPTQPIPLPGLSAPNPYLFHSSKSLSEMNMALVLALALGFLRYSSTPEHPISSYAIHPPPTNLVQISIPARTCTS